MSRAVLLPGGCQCGAVRFALHAMPRASICHCRMCQKAVGAPFAALAAVSVADLEWVRGAPKMFQSSSIGTRGFCGDCGTPLTYQGLDKGEMDITICSLDDPNAVPPLRQHGMEGEVSWLAGLADLPARPTEPEYDGLVNYQHPDRPG